jgi:ankyrin repeat protein
MNQITLKSTEKKAGYELMDPPINAQDKEGRTPLHIAVRGSIAAMGREYFAIIKLLLEQQDIDVNGQDIIGRMPRYYIVQRALKPMPFAGIPKPSKSLKIAMLRLFLENPKVDINGLDICGNTLLQLFAITRNISVAKLLLEKEKCNIFVKNCADQAPLYIGLSDAVPPGIAVEATEIVLAEKAQKPGTALADAEGELGHPENAVKSSRARKSYEIVLAEKKRERLKKNKS